MAIEPTSGSAGNDRIYISLRNGGANQRTGNGKPRLGNRSREFSPSQSEFNQGLQEVPVFRYLGEVTPGFSARKSELLLQVLTWVAVGEQRTNREEDFGNCQRWRPVIFQDV